MIREYDQPALLSRLEHRHENVLIDHVVMTVMPDHTVGECRLCVSESDSRSIFFQPTSQGQAILSAVYMEIAALASIVCTDYNRDHLIVFASISQFVVHRSALIGDMIVSTVTKGKEKAGFIRCHAQLRTGEYLLATGQLMAYVIDPSKLGDGAPSKQGTCPDLSDHAPVPREWFTRQDPMIWVDAVRHDDPAAGVFVTSYQYPDDHPFTKGHFPGKPIMMGVMQIQAIEDSVVAWAHRHGKASGHVRFDAEIIREADGALTCECRGMAVALHATANGVMTQLGTIDKVAFREPVSPNTPLLMVLKSIQWAC